MSFSMFFDICKVEKVKNGFNLDKKKFFRKLLLDFQISLMLLEIRFPIHISMTL